MKMKALSIILLILVCLVVTVLVGKFLTTETYRIFQDIESVMHRAQVASSATDMLKYMQNLQGNMADHGLTHGHTALIFKTPANDLGLLNESISNIIERLKEIQDLPSDGNVYQNALDDIRGVLRELERPTFGYIWV